MNKVKELSRVIGGIGKKKSNGGTQWYLLATWQVCDSLTPEILWNTGLKSTVGR